MKKTKWIWLGAGVCLLALAVTAWVLLLPNSSNATRQSIVLPVAAEESAQASVQEEAQSSAFVGLDAENVLTILETLERPDCFYQAYTLEHFYEEGSAMQTVEVWGCGAVYKLQLTTEGQLTRHYLSDGQTLYLWYEGEAQAVQTVLPEGWCLEDLMGVPSYAALLEAGAAILDVSTVELSGLSAAACIYIQYQGAAENVLEYAWISLDSGMLVQAHTQSDGSLTYRMAQTDLQILSASDAIWPSVLQLPDGTLPFGVSSSGGE